MLVNNLCDLLTILFPLNATKQLVSVVLENYGGPNKKLENVENDKQGHQSWVQEVLKNEGHVSSSPGVPIRLPSWQTILNDKE